MPKLNTKDPNRTIRVSDFAQEGFFIVCERERHRPAAGMSPRWEENQIAITREEIEKLERVTRPKVAEFVAQDCPVSPEVAESKGQ